MKHSFLDSSAKIMNGRGQNAEINMLGMFVSIGLTKSDRTPNPALAVWDSFRNKEQLFGRKGE